MDRCRYGRRIGDARQHPIGGSERQPAVTFPSADVYRYPPDSMDSHPTVIRRALVRSSIGVGSSLISHDDVRRQTAASADKVRGGLLHAAGGGPIPCPLAHQAMTNHPAAMAESCANSPPSQTTHGVNSLRAKKSQTRVRRHSRTLPGCTRPNSAAGMWRAGNPPYIRF